MNKTRIIILCILFSNIFVELFQQHIHISYWDEIVAIVLGGMLLYKVLKNKKKINNTNFNVCVLIIFAMIIGIIGNVRYQYMTSPIVIVKDIVGYAKYFVVLIAMQELELHKILLNALDKKFYNILKKIILFQFVAMIVSQFIDIGMATGEIRNGMYTFKFLFGHPTFMVSANIMILILLQGVSEKVDKIKVYQLLTLLIIVGGMRTKGIVFVAIYIFLKYCPNWVRKNSVYCVMIGALIVVIFSFQKVSLYASWSTSPREVFYKESINLSIDAFPIGTGFGSFCSHISAQNGSMLYETIYIPRGTDDMGEITPVFGDAGYPYYLAQFGLIGVLSIAAASLLLFLKTCKKIVPENEYDLAPYLVWLYIAVALTSEAILINIGVELAIILAVVSRRQEERKIENRNSNTVL